MYRALLLALALALPMTAQAMDMVMAGALKITGAYSPATPPTSRTAAGYMTIENTGASDDTLLSASGSMGMVQLHKSSTDANGVARMEHQADGIPLPAGQTVTLEPGGLHVMFMGLAEPFGEGATVTITLSFAKAGEVEVMLPVLPRGEAPKGGAHSH